MPRNPRNEKLRTNAPPVILNTEAMISNRDGGPRNNVVKFIDGTDHVRLNLGGEAFLFAEKRERGWVVYCHFADQLDVPFAEITVNGEKATVEEHCGPVVLEVSKAGEDECLASS